MAKEGYRGLHLVYNGGLHIRGGATTVRPRTVIIACQRHVTRCGTLMHPRGNAISSVRFSVLCSALATAPSREAM